MDRLKRWSLALCWVLASGVAWAIAASAAESSRNPLVILFFIPGLMAMGCAVAAAMGQPISLRISFLTAVAWLAGVTLMAAVVVLIKLAIS